MNRLISVLNIGSKKISVVSGSIGVNDIFIVKAKSETDYAGYADGEWLDIKNLPSVIVDTVRQAEELIGNRIKKLYVGVPGEFITVMVKELKLEFTKPHVVTLHDLNGLYSEGSVYEESGEYVAINSAPIYYTLDNASRLVDPVGSVVTQLKGLISFILADRKFYNLMVKVLSKIGLKEIEFISSNWAEGMYLFDDETRDKYALIANVGYISSGVSLFRGDGIIFHRAFSLGIGHIDADLMSLLNISYTDANALRQKVNLSLKPAEGDTYTINVKGKSDSVYVTYIQSIVSARIMDIAELILECINLSDYDCPSYLPLNITGEGASALAGAKDIIGRITDRRVEILSPNVPEHSKPQYSEVFGVMYVAQRLEKKNRGINKLIERIFHF